MSVILTIRPPRSVHGGYGKLSEPKLVFQLLLGLLFTIAPADFMDDVSALCDCCLEIGPHAYGLVCQWLYGRGMVSSKHL